VGVRNGASILLGAVVAWVAIAARLVRAGVAHPDFGSLVSWLLWPGVGLMLAGALTSIALDWRMMMRGVADLRRARPGPAVTELISLKLSTGLGWSAIALTVCIAWRIFGVGPVTCLLAVVVSVLLSSACARTTGETDVAPVGPMGGLTQILMGLFAPGQPIA